MLKDVGYHVVAELVLSQVQYSQEYFIKYGSNLLFLAVFQHPLYDSASELMHRHFIDLILESIYNKLDLLTFNGFNNLLDHVVTVGILDTLYHTGFYLVY